jgi:histidinol phosphatase-like enzyme
MPKRRAVFLDRDGTLMEEVNYCNDPATVQAIRRRLLAVLAAPAPDPAMNWRRPRPGD